MTVESNRADLSMKDLVTEFDLERLPDYIERYNRAEVFTRKGQPSPPQPPRRVPAIWD